MQITGFGTDSQGEMLIADHGGNAACSRLEPTPREDNAAQVPHQAERKRTVHLGQGAQGRTRP